MAKYTVTHSCGHDQVHQIVGPTKDRDRKAAWLGESVCGDCFAAKRLVDRQAAATVATETASASGWAVLTGSDKQIAWAETIRVEAIGKVRESIASMVASAAKQPHSDEVKAELSQALAAYQHALESQALAAWWIDNRTLATDPRSIMTAILQNDGLPKFMAARGK